MTSARPAYRGELVFQVPTTVGGNATIVCIREASNTTTVAINASTSSRNTMTGSRHSGGGDWREVVCMT